MATSRAPCQSCSLPFYTDENDQCPYCGQVVPDGGVTDTPSARPRTTCDSCGLAYYEDEQDDCPYCARTVDAAAHHETSAEEIGDAGAVEEAEEAETSTDVDGTDDAEADSTRAPTTPEAADRDEEVEDQRSSTLLGALFRPFRNLFGR